MPSPANDVAARARRRIARRLLPFLFILYVISFLDRVNVAYAALEMTHDLGFAGPFVVGYLQTATGSFGGGMAYLVVSLLAAGLLVLRLQPGRDGTATRQGVPRPTVPRS